MSAVAVTTGARGGPRPLRLASEELLCEVAPDLGAVEHLRAQWDRLVASVGAPVGMTWDYCRVWWTHYGAGRDCRIYLFRDDYDLVGVVPVCIDRVGIGPARLRVARLMGSDSTPGLCGLPVRSTWAPTVVEALLEQLIGEGECDAVHFGPISQASADVDAVRVASRGRPQLVSILRDRVVTQHTTITLPETFEAYLAGLSRNQRVNYRKGWGRLTGDFRVALEVITDPEPVRDELREFVRMHAAQWRHRGRPGHFGDWPGATAFHESLASAMSKIGRARLLRLRAGKNVVARQYGYLFGGTWHALLAARATTSPWNGYGLGRSSLVTLAEQAIAEGARTVDVGVGRYEYKNRLGGRTHDVRSMLVVANDGTARRRAARLGRVADAIDRLYYRLWFCRVAPRLPLRPRPLHPTWIRTRF